MKWAEQLMKLSNFELELLQARLADVVAKREAAQVRLAVLDAEGEGEMALARIDPESAWRISAFNEGLKHRKASAQREIELTETEERGARDALAEAFETLKRYEQVAENARTAAARETARREGQALDEIGLRRAAGRR